MSSPATHDNPPLAAAPILNCRGRVRTGCLVCRARKVKCDEQRPTCRKCIRLKKTCVYRIPSTCSPPMDPSPGRDGGQLTASHLDQAQNGARALKELEGRSTDENHRSHRDDTSDPMLQDVVQLPNLHLPTATHSGDPSLGESASSLGQNYVQFTESPPNRFQQASQLIHLSIATDWMAACEAPTESSFIYFIDVVDCPLLAPFDRLNWERVKYHIVYIGFQQPPVAQALLAVQVLYRAQVDRLPMAHALSVYKTGIASFQSVVDDGAVDFDVVLIMGFLLCLCAVTLPNEEDSPLAIFEGAFEEKLENWLLSGSRSPIGLRLCAWLQMLGTATKRQGSPGILPGSVASLLYKHVKEVPSLSHLDTDQHPERSFHDAIADPVFAFCLRLRAMSHRVADVTHYHRSRTTPEDQVEVTGLMDTLNTELAHLWENRPVPLRLPQHKIREYFAPPMSESIIKLSGLCIAAFHTESIIIGRILGDRPFPSPEARDALDQIRAIIDGDWNAFDGSTLNPGYVRPLFAYALEVCDKSELTWAADRLRQITQPASRGNFLASFVEAHGEAQRAQGRRITMKFFCYQTFGIPLPFM